MNNTTQPDAKNYLSFQGLAGLKAQSRSNPQAVQDEMAQQFESLLVQMMLKSMREANKSLSNDAQGDSSGELYQDLFDKQVALSISKNGIGLSKTIHDYLKRTDAHAPASTSEIQQSTMSEKLPEPQTQLPCQEKPFNNEGEFVNKLWKHAKQAASLLGLDPKLLLAQAALETGWGKHIIPHDTKGSSHNLFNIKADSSWKKDKIAIDTFEHRDGVVVKEKGLFRAYDSYAESFNDYVHFIKSNPRYQEALKQTQDPETYVTLLKQANYATDEHYPNKIMSIYRGDRFNQLLSELHE